MYKSISYAPLNESKSEIRVLDVLPSNKFEDQICCRLRIVSLDDAIDFEAISWCWGNAQKASTLNIDDHDFYCSPNLESALRHFRDSREMRTFWADAACINQQDEKEMGVQILLMGRIYTGANIVRVWLGDTFNDSDLAMDIIAKLQRNPSLLDVELDESGWTEKMVTSVCELMERPWWERIWVMQEVALARLVIFHCGNATFASERLEEMVEGVIYNAINSGTDAFQYLEANSNGSLTIRFVEALDRMSPVLGAMEIVQRVRNNETPSLQAVQALRALSKLKATDPRDKVAGCLGMLPGLADLMLPTFYANPADIVYMIASMTLILHHRSFYPLCFVRSRRTIVHQGESIKMPSWCLDFASAITKTSSLSMLFSDGLSWGPFKPKFRFPFIETSAVFFDEILTCHPMSPDWESVDTYTSIEQARGLHTTWRAFFGLALETKDHSSYVAGGSLENAYWRTLTGDLYHNIQNPGKTKRLKRSQIEAFTRWLRDPMSKSLSATNNARWNDDKTALEYNFSVLASSKSNNNYLFRSKRGFIGMGMGEPDLQEGDQLHFLEKGEVPWALRPVQDPSEGTVFEVISDCCVHGMMDGQPFQCPPQPDSKAFKRHALRRKLFGGQPFDPNLPLPPFRKIVLT